MNLQIKFLALNLFIGINYYITVLQYYFMKIKKLIKKLLEGITRK